MDNEERQLLVLLNHFRAADWKLVIVDWCSRFHGWRADEVGDPDLEVDPEPMAQVVRGLEPLRYKGQDILDFDIANVLASCEFQGWQAALTTGRKLRWRPHQESYLRFRSRGPIRRWLDTEPLYSEEILRGFILGHIAIYRQTGELPGARGTPRDPTTH